MSEAKEKSKKKGNAEKKDGDGNVAKNDDDSEGNKGKNNTNSNIKNNNSIKSEGKELKGVSKRNCEYFNLDLCKNEEELFGLIGIKPEDMDVKLKKEKEDDSNDLDVKEEENNVNYKPKKVEKMSYVHGNDKDAYQDNMIFNYDIVITNMKKK